MKDKIIFDIETKNTFDDVGGRDNIEKLEVSLIGAYSYNQDKYFAFRDNEIDKFGPLLQNAGLVIGFASNRFDLPVLKKYYPFNVMALPKLDLLEEIEFAYGARISLSLVAQTNLNNIDKIGKGLDAIEYYKKGDWEALEKYCLQDVKVTKEVYDFIKNNGYLHIPQKFTDELIKVPITLKELETPATLF